MGLKLKMPMFYELQNNKYYRKQSLISDCFIVLSNSLYLNPF